jgi:sec-independent protein translocase protein TatA
MIGSGEAVVLMGLALLLFGGKKVPELARNLGEGLKEFRKACQDTPTNHQEVSNSHQVEVKPIQESLPSDEE